MIKAIWTFVSSYRKYLIAAGVALALVFGGKVYLDRLEHKAYDRGYQQSELVWSQKRSEMQHTIDNKFIENSYLVAALRARTAEKQKLIDQMDKATSQKQIEYAASDSGKKVGLDLKFIEVYNESLGVK